MAVTYTSYSENNYNNEIATHKEKSWNIRLPSQFNSQNTTRNFLTGVYKAIVGIPELTFFFGGGALRVYNLLKRE